MNYLRHLKFLNLVLVNQVT